MLGSYFKYVSMKYKAEGTEFVIVQQNKAV